MEPNNPFLRKKLFIDCVLIIFLIAIVTCAQLVFLKPPALSDQLDYFLLASRFPEAPEVPQHRALRLGLLIPLSLLIRIFGFSEIAYYAIPFVSLIFFTLGIFLLANLFFKRTIAFLSTLLAIFIPNFLRYASDLLPDVPSSALIIMAFYGLILSGLCPLRNSFKKKPAFFILIGILLGWSYMVRESIAIVFPTILVIFYLFRIPAKNLLFVAFGFISVVSIEFAYGYINYGNPFIRFAFAQPRPTVGGVSLKTTKIITYLYVLLKKYNTAGYILLLFLSFFGSFFYSFRKNRKFQFLLLWFINVYFALTLIGLLPVIRGWKNYTILRLRLFRYWIPIIPAWIIGGISFADHLVRVFLRRIFSKIKTIRITAQIILITFSVFTIFTGNKNPVQSGENIRNGNDHYIEFRNFLIHNGNQWDTIWISRDYFRATERVIPMYSKNPAGKQIWLGSFSYLNDKDIYLQPAEIKNGLVVIDREYMNPQIYQVPEYLFSPPDNWCNVFSSENDHLRAYDAGCQ